MKCVVKVIIGTACHDSENELATFIQNLNVNHVVKMEGYDAVCASRPDVMCATTSGTNILLGETTTEKYTVVERVGVSQPSHVNSVPFCTIKVMNKLPFARFDVVE